MKLDVEKLGRTLDAARAQYPVVGRVLDGRATKADMASFAKAARALGLVEVAEGVELALRDPQAMISALGSVGPELAELFGEGVSALDEVRKLETIVNAFRGK
jgi:hypothetical protein